MSELDPLDVRGLERVQSEADDRTKAAQRSEAEDLKWLMSNKRGRRFVARLLDRAGVWRLSFNTNALVMSFNEGTRNEGLRLLAQVRTHCPERFTEMLKEQDE